MMKRAGTKRARTKIGRSNGSMTLNLRTALTGDATDALNQVVRIDEEETSGDFASTRDIRHPEIISAGNITDEEGDLIGTRWVFYQMDPFAWLKRNFSGLSVFNMMKMSRPWMSIHHMRPSGMQLYTTGGGGTLVAGTGTIAANKQWVNVAPVITLHYQYLPLTSHPFNLTDVGAADGVQINAVGSKQAFLADRRTKHVSLRPGQRILFPIQVRQWIPVAQCWATPLNSTVATYNSLVPYQSRKPGWMETAAVFGIEGNSSANGYPGGLNVSRMKSNYIVMYFEIPRLPVGSEGLADTWRENLIIKRNQGMRVRLIAPRVAAGGVDPFQTLFKMTEGEVISRKTMSTLENQNSFQTWAGIRVERAPLGTIETVPSAISATARIYGPSGDTSFITPTVHVKEPGDDAD